ncbi:hypothetical protein ACFOY4_02280 [Actinomadura syzygii]|uniref:YceI family protein n=1 Tax=Actinomadura syzygii TaxID=1427538 RepID=A0A5D0TWM4_9ACTN|nr:hypothetical protein [Actinomadura syzygii]TYC10247.1 hypothetical protein FXF65_30390 [Actinomadura syzygii]
MTQTATILGSKHFAGVRLDGEITLHFLQGETFDCRNVEGISGVRTASEVTRDADGRPQVALERLLTHFHSDEADILIEQNHARQNKGTLTGHGEELLPGTATFEQYLLITVGDKVYANRDALVMTSTDVSEWAPVGSTFTSKAAVDFYAVDEIDDAAAKPVLTLAAKCAAEIRDELSLG